MINAGLGDRIRRLLTANVHALVSTLESKAPQAVLEQYLRDFDEVIAQARVGLGQHEASRHQAAKAIARLNNEMERLDEQVALALDQGDEAAARAGAERQIDLEDQLVTLNGGLQDVVDKAQSAETDLLGLRAKRAEMEQALKEMIAARAAAQKSEPSLAGTPYAHGAQRAERLAEGFNRTMADASGLAGLGASDSKANASLLSRLETLHRQQRVTERLARVKGAKEADSH